MIIINPYMQATKWSAAKAAAISSLSSLGYFQRMDKLFVPKGAKDIAAASSDWKNGTNATIHGSATWTQADGFCGSIEAGSYIGTGFTASTDAVNVTPNSAGYGCIITKLPTATNSAFFGANTLPDGNRTRTRLYARRSTYNDYGSQGSTLVHGSVFTNDGVITAKNSLSTGFHQLNRTASNALSLWVNGALLGTTSVNKSDRALPTLEMYILAENDSGISQSLSDGALGAWWAGDDFTPAEQNNIQTILNTYYAAVA